MLSRSFTFHHLGLAVRDEAGALEFLKNTGYAVGERVHDPEQNVHLRMCTSEAMPAVEIVMPGEGDHPLSALLRRQPATIYHTCYEVDNREEVLTELEERGVRCLPVSPPKPAVLFGGRLVSFYHIPGFGLIELLETPAV